MEQIPTTTLQDTVRIVLGCFMIYAAIAHFTFRRREFHAQVPPWLPFSPDFVVVASGIVELVLGLAMIFWFHQKVIVELLSLFSMYSSSPETSPSIVTKEMHSV
jgi:uncharacterized membrane protein